MKLEPPQSRPSPPTLQAQTSESEPEGSQKKGWYCQQSQPYAEGVPVPGQQWGKAEHQKTIYKRSFGNKVHKQQLLIRNYPTLIHVTMRTPWSCNQISINVPLSRVKTHANPMKKPGM